MQQQQFSFSWIWSTHIPIFDTMILVLKRLIINSTPWYQRRGISSNLSRPCLSFKNAFATIKMLKSHSVRGEPVSGPSNFPPPLMITYDYITYLTNTSFQFFEEKLCIAVHSEKIFHQTLFVPIFVLARMKQNFDYHLIEALFRCWRTRYERTRYYFPLLIFPSRWIEKRKKWNSLVSSSLFLRGKLIGKRIQILKNVSKIV